MKTNFSMLFYLKKQNNYTSGPMPIYQRITVNGNRAEITTNRECEPLKWNSHAGRAIPCARLIVIRWVCVRVPHCLYQK